MQKILTCTLDDICADADAVCARIQQACAQRSGPYRVRGLMQVGENVYIALESVPGARPPERYVLVEVTDSTEAAVVAVLAGRWSEGFDGIGAVNTPDGLSFLLFAAVEGKG